MTSAERRGEDDNDDDGAAEKVYKVEVVYDHPRFLVMLPPGEGPDGPDGPPAGPWRETVPVGTEDPHEDDDHEQSDERRAA